MHSNDVSLVAKSIIISSKSDMWNSTPLTNVLIQDILNSDADYVENTLMSEINSVTEQELKELTILLRTRAQSCNQRMKNMTALSDKREHDHSVIKAPTALLPLLKSDSQSI